MSLYLYLSFFVFVFVFVFVYTRIHYIFTTYTNQCIWPEFEVDEEDVPVEGSHSKVVDVQVLDQLPQVGVEDVGEERVEHIGACLPEKFLASPFDIKKTIDLKTNVLESILPELSH